MSPWIPVIAALGGGLVAGVSNFVNNLIDKKAEEQKQVRALIFNAAIENWKMQWEYGKLKREDGIYPLLLPVEAALLHMTKISNMLFSEKITKDNLKEKAGEMREFSDLLESIYQESE
jgi:hypothetical protein